MASKLGNNSFFKRSSKTLPDGFGPPDSIEPGQQLVICFVTPLLGPGHLFEGIPKDLAKLKYEPGQSTPSQRFHVKLHIISQSGIQLLTSKPLIQYWNSNLPIFAQKIAQAEATQTKVIHTTPNILVVPSPTEENFKTTPEESTDNTQPVHTPPHSTEPSPAKSLKAAPTSLNNLDPPQSSASSSTSTSTTTDPVPPYVSPTPIVSESIKSKLPNIPDDNTGLETTKENGFCRLPSHKMTRKKFIDNSKRRYGVLLEVLATETRYIEDLHWMENKLKSEILEKKLITKDQSDKIFLNIEILYRINKFFRDILKKRVENFAALDRQIGAFQKNHVLYDSIILSDIYTNLGNVCLNFYSEFCSNVSNAKALAESLLWKDKSFQNINLRLQKLHPRRLSMEDMLIQPMQRVCQYPLLLRDIVKATPTDHIDYIKLKIALDAFEIVVHNINENKRIVENANHIFSFMNRIRNLPPNFNLVAPGRRLIFQGPLIKVNKSGMTQERYFILFNDIILYCSMKRLSDELKYKGHIPLRRLIIRDVPDLSAISKTKVGFQLIRTDSNRIYPVMTRDPKMKTKWLQHLYGAFTSLMQGDYEYVSRLSAPSALFSGSFIGALSKRPRLEREKVDIQLLTGNNYNTSLKQLNSTFENLISTFKVDPKLKSEYFLSADVLNYYLLPPASNPIRKILGESLEISHDVDQDDHVFIALDESDDDDDDDDDSIKLPLSSRSSRSNRSNSSSRRTSEHQESRDEANLGLGLDITPRSNRSHSKSSTLPQLDSSSYSVLSSSPSPTPPSSRKQTPLVTSTTTSNPQMTPVNHATNKKSTAPATPATPKASLSYPLESPSPELLNISSQLSMPNLISDFSPFETSFSPNSVFSSTPTGTKPAVLGGNPIERTSANSPSINSSFLLASSKASEYEFEQDVEESTKVPVPAKPQVRKSIDPNRFKPATIKTVSDNTRTVVTFFGNSIGKTSIIQKHIDGKVNHPAPTIEDEHLINLKVPVHRRSEVLDLNSMSVEIPYPGQRTTLNIMDISGHPDNQSRHADWVKQSHGFCLVFSLADANSFDDLRYWYSVIRSNWVPGNLLHLKKKKFSDDLRDLKLFNQYGLRGTDWIPIVLVGTQSDIQPHSVRRAHAYSFAKMIHAPYVECSSLSGAGIEDVFYAIYDTVFQTRTLSRLYLTFRQFERSFKPEYPIIKLSAGVDHMITPNSSLQNLFLQTEADLHPGLISLLTILDSSTGANFFASNGSSASTQWSPSKSKNRLFKRKNRKSLRRVKSQNVIKATPILQAPIETERFFIASQQSILFFMRYSQNQRRPDGLFGYDTDAFVFNNPMVSIEHLSFPHRNFVTNPFVYVPLYLFTLFGFLDAKFKNTLGIFRLIGSPMRTREIENALSNYQIQIDDIPRYLPHETVNLYSTHIKYPHLWKQSFFFQYAVSGHANIAAKYFMDTNSELTKDDGLICAQLILRFFNKLEFPIFNAHVHHLLLEAAALHIKELSIDQLDKETAYQHARDLSIAITPIIALMREEEESMLMVLIMFLHTVFIPCRKQTLVSINLLSSIFVHSLFRPVNETFQDSFYMPYHKELLKSLLLFPPPHWAELWKAATKTKIDFRRPPPPPVYGASRSEPKFSPASIGRRGKTHNKI